MKMCLAEVGMKSWAVMQQLLYQENTDVCMREVSLLLDHLTVPVMGQDPAANHLLIHAFRPILRFG